MWTLMDQSKSPVHVFGFSYVAKWWQKKMSQNRKIYKMNADIMNMVNVIKTDPNWLSSQ